MTRSRPSPFARYIAASALAMSSSGVSPCDGYSATPTLTVILPPPNCSAATRARMRSPTVVAVASVVSSNITRNSSPPYRATESTPRVVFRRISGDQFGRGAREPLERAHDEQPQDVGHEPQGRQQRHQQ